MLHIAGGIVLAYLIICALPFIVEISAILLVGVLGIVFIFALIAFAGNVIDSGFGMLIFGIFVFSLLVNFIQRLFRKNSNVAPNANPKQPLPTKGQAILELRPKKSTMKKCAACRLTDIININCEMCAILNEDRLFFEPRNDDFDIQKIVDARLNRRG